MTWGVLIVLGIGLFLTYVIWQETRSHLAWRALVNQGNVWAIRELVLAEIDRWHNLRPPKGMPLALWTGVQSVELVSTGRDHIQVACGAEGEYRTLGGRREQLLSPLDSAMRLASKLIDMLLYDIPEVKIGLVRVDVFSGLGTTDGAPAQGCILSVAADRSTANTLIWEELTPREVVDSFEAIYAFDESGGSRAIDPGPPLPDEPAVMPEGLRETRAQRRARREAAVDAKRETAPEPAPEPLIAATRGSGVREPDQKEARPPVRIVLIGMSGSGKSTVARLLARELGWAVADTDEMIASAEGCDIARIFREQGESVFRVQEGIAITALAPAQKIVIATGGGAAERAANRARLWTDALVVRLVARPETLLARLASDPCGEARPLLAGDDPLGRLKALAKQREPQYARADLTIDTDDRTPAQVAGWILRAYRTEAGRLLGRPGRMHDLEEPPLLH